MVCSTDRYTATYVVAPSLGPPDCRDADFTDIQTAINALPPGGGKVFVGWRLLGTDPEDIGFNLYRSTSGRAPVKLNPEPLRNATSFVDSGANSEEALSYFVRPVQDPRRSATIWSCEAMREKTARFDEAIETTSEEITS